MIELVEMPDPGARIKVIGAGGCGGNAVNHMIQAGLRNVEFISVNTDIQALQNNVAPVRMQIGQQITRGRGTGGNPEIGRKAALEDEERLREYLAGAEWFSSPPEWAAAPAPARRQLSRAWRAKPAL